MSILLRFFATTNHDFYFIDESKYSMSGCSQFKSEKEGQSDEKKGNWLNFHKKKISQKKVKLNQKKKKKT